MSFLEIGKLQVELQVKPPPYTVVKESLHKLQDNYVKQKRAEIEAVVREALLKRVILKDAQEAPNDDNVVSTDKAMPTRAMVPIMETIRYLHPPIDFYID